MVSFMVFSAKDRIVATVFLNNLRDNFFAVKKAVPHGVGICAVVKADAYGHGAQRVSELCESLGVSYLAVASPEEALSLRSSGITSPILVLGFTPPHYIEALAEHGITQTVYSEEYARMLLSVLYRCSKALKIHLKIDSGMSRLGFRPRELYTVLDALKSKSFVTEGIYTHFSCADECDRESVEFTKRQCDVFTECVEFLDSSGIHIPIRHAANSAAIAGEYDFSFDMVRAGLMLYGYRMVKSDINVSPAMELKTVISQIKTLECGESVGYGRAFVADKSMRIATLPIGYADGIPRCASRLGLSFFIGDFPVKIVGRVCMDQLMVDITDVPTARPFDEVLIFGRDIGKTAENTAHALDTISYEILCGVPRRAKREYKDI